MIESSEWLAMASLSLSLWEEYQGTFDLVKRRQRYQTKSIDFFIIIHDGIVVVLITRQFHYCIA